MKIVFYSLILNNHQANVADELWELTGHSYCFVELANLQGEHRKGDTHDYGDRPYLLRAWESGENYSKAMELARTADVCVFSGVQALPFQRERLKLGLLSFDMSERWLKRGLVNLFSPAIFKMFLAYYLGGWKHKPLYKLCCSAFAADDHHKLGMYRGRCFKWGYFTRVEKIDAEALLHESDDGSTPLMWCARYLTWKHPELPLLMAARLKANGYRFTLDMYGGGKYDPTARRMTASLGITDVVHFVGNKPNDELLADMRRHSIFLFTSDRNEGWGAVANESMACGCVLVAADAIGSTPYLIKDGITGLSFRSSRTSCSFDNPDKKALDSLCEKVKWLLDNPSEMAKIRNRSVELMQELYNPRTAAERLLTLIDCLQKSSDPGFSDGPCSIA